MPVRASGLMLTRSSIAIRTSSSQSMSSRDAVTRPMSSASSASMGSWVLSAAFYSVGLSWEASL